MNKADTKSDTAPGDEAKIHELGPGCYAISAEGCPNTGVIVGDRGLLVVDAQPTEALGQKVLNKIREISDKPIKVLLLTHFHGDSTAGAAAFDAGEVIASDLTKRMMETRGLDDRDVLKSRFPEIYPAGQPLPPLAIPSMTIASSMSVDLGGKEVRLMHLGRGHTMGDLVVWVADSGVLFAGDLVQSRTAPYCGDAHLTDWPRALDRLMAFRPNALMPGHGTPVVGNSEVATAIETTRDYVITLRDAATACTESKMGLRDTYQSISDALQPRFGSASGFDAHLPFNVARAYDEAQGLDQPQVWTRERCADLEDALTQSVPVAEEPELAETVLEIVEDQPASPDEPASEPEALNVIHLEERETVEQTDEAAEAESGGEEAAELVSDSEFAASLMASLTEQGADDDDALLLENEIETEEKVLEKAQV
ncbi:MBL fold metallo-hydrolase [Labrenzia sp. PHM005]|uniref:MBL fold metallo-hydrolase n=1 Tax=Labrenzia sp. PHM005 TaxID=2590016 RepID=UPI0011407998|nr:MBL fold metallo-hydrolase [Labrenzia sp. PHM005]QDG78092.1 MBL fold metallo-hydrolase [Labrenzia sp. PHM005]